VGDSNNHRAARLPPAPHPQLRQLERLVGRWEVGGSYLQGLLDYDWLEGGFFLIQRVDCRTPDRQIRGVEYIGFDEDTQTLRSHYMDIHGANFTYTWELEGDTLRIWFGERGSDNCFEGRFSDDGCSCSGAWRWPGGGYAATLKRVG
jgi:hypothetical protein